ncbi:hypothetical protein BDZ91DRAFT_732077 [Kalaharituber pfeilii]|nr:hypothetical protein BDZ91DRAFT_732077 [Kalaharituber pfeilii]
MPPKGLWRGTNLVTLTTCIARELLHDAGGARYLLLPTPLRFSCSDIARMLLRVTYIDILSSIFLRLSPVNVSSCTCSNFISPFDFLFM